MSPQGEFLDLDIDSSKPRPGHSDERLWDSGMKVKASIDEAKKIWTGEMRIPIASIDKRPPQAGNELRINLFRQDGKVPKRDFLAWQTTGVWNPHRPEKFGKLRLVEAAKNLQKEPADVKLRNPGLEFSVEPAEPRGWPAR